MLRSRKLVVAVLTAGSALATIGLAAIPTASADTCVVTAKLLNGQTVSFTVNVAPGTPASSISLPVSGVVVGVSESCSSSSSSSSSSGGNGNSNGSSSSSSSSNASSANNSGPAPKAVGRGRNQPQSNHGGGGKKGSGKSGQKSPQGPGSNPSSPSGNIPSAPAKPGAIRGPDGVPTAANPTFSFAVPGPAALGVPNFFIDNFQVPPFLLPIFQAAGIQYDVPWQVLAAINEIETDYGRNLSTSNAGAVGWMQFLPETWKVYGVDATGSGYADPYNPVDAIFAAGRYLHAAGASKNLRNAIYAYNHADWYVQSVLLRAKLIGGMPDALIGALGNLVEGHFPVAAPAKYADDYVEQLANRRVKHAITVESNPKRKAISIYTRVKAPVIAVNDGKIIKVGRGDKKLGNYIELQDSTGNVFTYAQLGSIPDLYPVPKPVDASAKGLTQALSAPSTPRPSGPATAGAQGTAPIISTKKATKEANAAPISLPVASDSSQGATKLPTPMPKERLFANPYRPASFAAGGDLQIKNTQAQITSFQNYFSQVLHLGKGQYTLQPLKAGSPVIAGTILGRVGPGSQGQAPHVQFMIRPAGKNAPFVDPKPVLDGWKLLEATAIYRASGLSPFAGKKNPMIGQMFLMSKEQLQVRVLSDPKVQIYACGRRDIQAGTIDRRILADIEFLSMSGLKPYVSGLSCGHTLTGANGVDAAGATGSSVDISKINNIPVLGNQGNGSITDLAIKRLLTLQGNFRPDQIVSLRTYKGKTNTLKLPDHANRIQVTYTPLFGSNKKLSQEIKAILQPGQWIQLINRISQIPEPTVPIAPSKFAIRVGSAGG